MKALLPVILTLGGIALVYFYAYPKYEAYKVLSVEEAEYDKALKQVKEIEVVKSQKLAKLNSIDPADLFRLDTMIREESAPLLVTLYLEELADAYNIDVQSLSTTGAAATDSAPTNSANREAGTSTNAVNYTPVSTSISFTASYDDFISFVRGIETNLEISDISSLSVSTNPDDSDYTVDMSFQTYLRT